MATALLLFALPAIGAAEANFDPGTLYQTLSREAYQCGRQVETAIRLQLDSVPQLPPEQLAALQKVLAGLEIHVSATDDIDEKIYTLAVSMDGKVILDGLAKADAQGIRIAGDLLPGITVLMPAEMLGALPFGLGPAQDAQGEDMAALVDAYINYFVIVGAWVSQKQTDREDLYVYEEAEGPAAEDSETRDAANLIMHSKVRPGDLKVLMRALADQFFDDDATQQAVANLLKPYGVTRADVRRWADQLPLWIAHGLNPTENPTEFAVSYGDDGEIVGFDGVMPAMYDKFFFEKGTLKYDRKTDEDAVIHRTRGEADFFAGERLVGELQIISGEPLDDTLKNEWSLSLFAAIPEQKSEVRYDLYNQQQYQAEEDFEIYDGLGKVDLAQNIAGEQSRMHAEYTVHSETKPVGDYDFTHQATVQIDAIDTPEKTGALSLTLTYEVSSKEYAKADLPANNELYDLSNLDETQRARLDTELSSMYMRVALQLMGALPPEALQLMMGQ